MFETRRLTSKIVLQVILTIMVIPYLFPLIAMVQESLAGQGWDNYRAVWASASSRSSSATRHHRGRRHHHRLRLTMLAAFGFSKLHIRGRRSTSG